jgi:hypothetical protein
VDGEHRDRVDARVPRKEYDHVCIDAGIDTLCVDKPAADLNKSIAPLFAMGGGWSIRETLFNMAPDGTPCNVVAGVNKRNLHDPFYAVMHEKPRDAFTALWFRSFEKRS